MIQEQIQTQAVPQSKSIPAKAYSVLEEWLNSISHGVGFIAAIVGLVFMLYRAEDTLALTTAAIYGSTGRVQTLLLQQKHVLRSIEGDAIRQHRFHLPVQSLHDHLHRPASASPLRSL